MKKLIASILFLVMLPLGALSNQEDISIDKPEKSSISINGISSDHKYDFPKYGSTNADLSPLYDYLSLLEENNIYLSIPNLLISNNEDHDWISADIGNGFWILYRPYNDGSRYSFLLQLPYSYRPIDEAFPLLLVSTLSIEINDAKEIYRTLQYNIMGETCELKTEDYIVSYYEPRYSDGRLGSFAQLEVTRFLK